MGTVKFGANHDVKTDMFNPTIEIVLDGRKITFTSDVEIKGNDDTFKFVKLMHEVLSGQHGQEGLKIVPEGSDNMVLDH